MTTINVKPTYSRYNFPFNDGIAKFTVIICMHALHASTDTDYTIKFEMVIETDFKLN